MNQEPLIYQLGTLPHANGAAPVSAKIRCTPADFFVEEILGFPLSSEGEHVYLQLEKTGQNTQTIAERIARLTHVPAKSIGYAGLKDRHAVTRQWFSVQLPKISTNEFHKLEAEDLKLISIDQHSKKLRRGALQGNRFQLVLRNLNGDTTSIDQRLDKIQQYGVPNYFGSQRFGHNENNVADAALWLSGQKKAPGRHLKGIHLSAVRAFLFNRVLAERIHQHCWDTAIPGDIMMLNGSHSCFPAPEITEELQQRILKQDLHPAAALPGIEGLQNSAAALELQQRVHKPFDALLAGLTRLKVKQDWRAMRVLVDDLQWHWLSADSLQLNFQLTAGSYATSVIAEFATLVND